MTQEPKMNPSETPPPHPAPPPPSKPKAIRSKILTKDELKAKAITALAVEGSLRAAAKKSGVSRATLAKWLCDRDFAAEVEEQKHARRSKLRRTAENTLEEIMEAPDAEDAARIAAARTTLEHVNKEEDREAKAMGDNPQSKPASLQWLASAFQRGRPRKLTLPQEKLLADAAANINARRSARLLAQSRKKAERIQVEPEIVGPAVPRLEYHPEINWRSTIEDA